MALPTHNEDDRAVQPSRDAGGGLRAPVGLLRDRWLWAVLACTALVSVHRFGNGFVMDDETMIVANDVIHSLSNVPAIFANHALFVSGEERETISTWRPLTLTLFVFDYQWSGARPWGYHLTNLVGHLVTTAFVVALARRLLPGPSGSEPGRSAGLPGWTAAAAGLFFGLHPASVEAQVWINGRSDVFAALFYAASAWVLLGRRATAATGRSSLLPPAASPPSVGRLASSAALFFAGALCKEVLVLGLPALLWLAWATHAEPVRARVTARAAVALGSATAVYAGLRTWVLDGAAAGTRDDQLTALLHLGVVWLDGIRTLLFPPALGMRVVGSEYATLPGWVFAAAWVAAVGAGLLALRARVRAPLVFAAVLSGAGFLAPIAVLSAVEWPGFNRYVYLPCVLFALAVAATADRVARSATGARPARLVMGGWLLLFAASQALGTAQYRTMRTFLYAIEDASPRARMLDASLGNLAFRDGDCPAARPRLERALIWEPHHVESRTHLALCLLDAGDLDGAEALLAAGLAELPAEGALWNALGRVHFERDVEAGTATLHACLTRADDPARCRRNLERLAREHPDAERVRETLRRLDAESAAPAPIPPDAGAPEVE